MDLILREKLYTQQTVDAYFIHRFLLELAPFILPQQAQTQDHHQRFYLKHADDKGDHIPVDEDFNMTGIIDWKSAYTISEAVAFKLPMLFLPVGDFFDGSNDIGKYETFFAQVLEEKGYRTWQSVSGRVEYNTRLRSAVAMILPIGTDFWSLSRTSGCRGN